MFRLVVLSFLVACIQGAAILPKAAPNDRIVGGFEIDISLIPYQVSLQEDDQHFCGGTLISPVYIISAAHCTFDKSADDILVRIGSNRLYEGGTIIPVSQIIDHPDYDDNSKDFDISILELITPQTFTMTFPTLPSASTLLEAGDWAIVSGWGDTKNSEESTDLLRAVYVPLVDSDECEDAYESLGGITPQMLCAGDIEEGGIDSCQGDSGGPLILNKVLIGVVSWGVGCGDVGYPGVYTNVLSFRSWITDKINM